jgi:hypothetical protein
MSHSKKTQAAIDVRVIMSAPIPKNHNEATSAGRSAIITPYMFFGTESPPCTCGDGEMTNFWFIVSGTLF